MTLFHDLLQVVLGRSESTPVLVADPSAPGALLEIVDGVNVIALDVKAMETAELSDATVLVLPAWRGRFARPEANLPVSETVASSSARRVVIPIPRSSLAQGSRDRCLASFATDWALELVVEGVRIDSRESAGLDLALVVLKRAAAPSGPVRFLKCPAAPDTSAVVNDLELLLSRSGGNTEFGYVTREEISVNRWDFDTYDPARLERQRDLAGLGELNEVGDVFKTMWPNKKTMGDVGPKVPVVLGVDLVKSKRDHEPDAIGNARARLAAEGAGASGASKGLSLQAGDILLPRFFDPLAPDRATVVTEAMLPLAAGSSVLVLRPKNALSESHLRFYGAYFSSERAFALAEKSTLAGHVGLQNFSRAPLPVLDEALSQALGQIDDARRSLGSWLDNGADIDASIFDTDSAAASRVELLERGRLLRQRIEAAERVDTLEYRVSQFYPLPIASRWRKVEIEVAARQWREAYEAILSCFETLVAFLALASLAIATSRRLDLGTSSDLVKKLSAKKHGLALGDWIQVVSEVATSRAFRELPDDDVLRQLSRGFGDSDPAGDSRVRLAKRRNDESHDRRVPEHALETAVHEALPDLIAVLEAVGGLADYRLVEVKSNEWDSISREGEALCEELTGDHVLSSVRRRAHATDCLESGSLYLVTPSGEWHLLRPFLARYTCRECGSKSVMYPDRGSASGLEFKPMDHGHPFTLVMDRARVALEAIGFLSEEASRTLESPDVV